MANPAIVYPYGSGSATLHFLRPPTKVPAYSSMAVRHDNVASSGVRESVLERIDNYLDLDLEWVGIGSRCAGVGAIHELCASGRRLCLLSR